ncbi:helix-turn-helix domain-containing protein [bacterium]|nr:helix-turn-helix domain-containing protein [bacterium]
MARKAARSSEKLHGHALRNANLRKRSLKRSETAPPLARKAVEIRVGELGMTRIELARQSGISRGALRDLELGVHTPTRNTLERFIEFCEERGVSERVIDELRDLYAGPADSIEHVIARLELRAGSSPKLARKVGVSAATMWEYRRGNFPVPHELLKKMCRALRVDFEPLEPIWHQAERERFINRGFPEALAEFCVLRLRAGHAESDLLNLGLGTAELRRLCYLELLPWARVSRVAKTLCRDDEELRELRDLWQRDYNKQKTEGLHDFGLRLKKIREKQKVTRREMADLFLIGGKKPARIIKHIEEDGHYSQQAYPAGIVALLTEPDREILPDEIAEPADAAAGGAVEAGEAPSRNGFLACETAAELRALWERRRIRFHLRHRPEMQLDLRLQREYFGFDVAQAAELLGYSNLEYQKIERGIESLTDSARQRIIDALEDAGHLKLREVFIRRSLRDQRRQAWRQPRTVTGMLKLLAEREGGVVPLARLLADAGLYGISPPRLRSYMIEEETPTWYLLQQIAETCGILKLQAVHIDWIHRYRSQLQQKSESLLAVELRLLVAEVAPTLRAFSDRLPFNYSVLLRDLYRVERREAFKWYHVERILEAAGLPKESERWRVIHRLWLNLN